MITSSNFDDVMLTYPHLNPIALSLGPFDIHWYGVMYLLGVLLGWALIRRRWCQDYSKELLSDFVGAVVLGIVIGGRLGYVTFYDTSLWWQAPWKVLAIWQGGMSFHGGLLGVIASMIVFARRHNLSFWYLSDLVAPVVPIGLGLGRLGNFINGELVGRVTDVPWGLVFLHVDSLPRHPSQLYEACCEGLLLFLFLQWYQSRAKCAGHVSAAFLLGYAIARFLLEYVRAPDPQIGLLWGELSLGQYLCIPMALAGIGIAVVSMRRGNESIS